MRALAPVPCSACIRAAVDVSFAAPKADQKLLSTASKLGFMCLKGMKVCLDAKSELTALRITPGLGKAPDMQMGDADGGSNAGQRQRARAAAWLRPGSLASAGNVSQSVSIDMPRWARPTNGPRLANPTRRRPCYDFKSHEQRVNKAVHVERGHCQANPNPTGIQVSEHEPRGCRRGLPVGPHSVSVDV